MSLVGLVGIDPRPAYIRFRLSSTVSQSLTSFEIMSKVVAQSTPAWLSGWRQCWRRYPDCQVFLALFGKARSAQMQKFCSNRSAAGQNRVHRLRGFLSHRPCDVCVRMAKPVNPENLTRNICSLNNSRKQISGKDYCPRSNQQPSTPRNTRYRHPPTSMQLSDGYR